jgi:HTH-type transcriptional regulator/antitoxin HigA
MAAESSTRWQPDWGVPPGEILSEILAHRGMTQAELARRTDRPVKTINLIVKGKAAITPDTALQFESALGVSARFWLNLESIYTEWAARTRQRERLRSDMPWLETFPINAMIQRGLLERASTRADHIEPLLRFFAVSSPSGWERQWRQVEAEFRSSPAFAAAPESVAVWLRQGELEAEHIDCKPFDPVALQNALPKIRALTERDPIGFLAELQTLLASCGVALVLVPELPGTHLSGAARWVSPSKAIIQLSLRHKTDAEFWFALFHEIGHLMRRGERRSHLDAPGQPHGLSGTEADADRFAGDFLIPTHDYQRFVSAGEFTSESIRKFAREIEIAPGLVVARLQRDRQITMASLNRLKRTIRWAEDV